MEIVPDGRTTVRVEARQWETLGPAAVVQGGEAAAGGVDLEEGVGCGVGKLLRSPMPDAFYM